MEWNPAWKEGVYNGGAVVGLILPGLPHPLLQPEGNPSWGEIRKGLKRFVSNSSMRRLNAWFCTVRSGSRFWVIKCRLMPIRSGHMSIRSSITLGSMPYSFKVDSSF